ncbi:uncharacterized protein SOCE26_063900 [Sorangium cellulosum]|uniref:Uncharacterized protein n=1 Tax=Sorangium cellulosum TaxID=56 RepID=A0A2L0F055_SORCE|nr:uncharacterized protein SOCE26_063900 [Sorangium cellulosum]
MLDGRRARGNSLTRRVRALAQQPDPRRRQPRDRSLGARACRGGRQRGSRRSRLRAGRAPRARPVAPHGHPERVRLVVGAVHRPGASPPVLHAALPPGPAPRRRPGDRGDGARLRGPPLALGARVRAAALPRARAALRLPAEPETPPRGVGNRRLARARARGAWALARRRRARRGAAPVPRRSTARRARPAAREAGRAPRAYGYRRARRAQARARRREQRPRGGPPVGRARRRTAGARGRFRVPLLHRLQGYIITLPPLRQSRGAQRPAGRQAPCRLVSPHLCPIGAPARRVSHPVRTSWLPTTRDVRRAED